MPSYYVKAETVIKKCKWCGGPMAVLGDLNKIFCSKPCHNKYKWKHERERQKAIKAKYQKSAKGRATLKAYYLKNRDKMRQYSREWKLMKRIVKDVKKIEKQNHKDLVINILTDEKETSLEKKFNDLTRELKQYKEVVESRMQDLKEKVLMYKTEAERLRMTKVNQFRRYSSDLKDVEFDVATLKNQVKAINKRIGGYEDGEE